MKVPTECGPIDELLEGGLEPGAVTLVYGEPASGKTNLALQAARSVVRQGLRVAYVDAEGISFDRLRQVGGELHKAMIQRILFANPLDLAEQGVRIDEATRLEDVGLVVVDSVNQLYRLELEKDPVAAGRMLLTQLGALQRAARKGRLPVLVTAQVYEAGEEVLPFGGRTMGHLVKTVLELLRPRGALEEPGLRRAVLRKHRAIQEGAATTFRITPTGLS